MQDLLAEYVPRVYRFALRLTHDCHVAEDIVQETFLRAWRGRLRLREPAAMRVWLFRIAANLWRDRLRKAESQKMADLELSRRVPARVADPGETVAQRERLEEALRILDSLPPRQREVLYLAAVEAMGAPDIAEVLGISAEAVKASLSLARRTVRQRFDALEEL